ncbi:MAG TPA: CRISPR-associated helicase Cas3' [Rhodocyclaceae bacterium]|nr:CRISPR-associated helicase Cas3' [Rhodocyclaceae bacterium]
MDLHWGKLSDDLLSSLPLTDHCIDVASVFRALCDLPTIQRNLGLKEDPVILDRLAVLALLHDLGKCNAGFQAKRDPDARNIAGHVKETAALIYDDGLGAKAYLALGLEEIVSWFVSPEAASRMLLASIFHHGKPAFDENIKDSIQISQLKTHWLPRNGLDPFDGLKKLGTTARRAYPNAFEGNAAPIEVDFKLEHRFAGLVMLADWLGSHRESFFPFQHKGDRIEWSRGQASKALAAVGLDVTSARKRIEERGQPTFGQAFGLPGEPRPLQTALASANLPALLIAESDTGSGKTEAALMHFLALFAASKVDGLYFALPTRVAARELYGRVTAAMNRVFGDDCPPVLLAVPGYTQVDGKRPDILPSDAHLFHEDDQKRRDRTWAAERPKRFLAAPIAVGTIDQALFSTIQVPHAHLRAACLDRSLLVIDEVHSSDVYMRYLTRRLLKRHIDAGGRALLLSATLGAAAREEYLYPDRPRPEAEPFEKAVALPYPALSVPDQPMQHLPDPSYRSKTVQLEQLPLLNSPELLLPRLREAMHAGRRVLVILNTVGRAIELTRLADADPKLAPALFAVNGMRCPHHGRFARADRERMDQTVSARMGKGSPPAALLLIGTQTLEQSLDIDADWLITDLCPIDVLLQRIGRLHRHDRGPRPMPTCTVLLPEETEFSVFLNRNGIVQRGNLAGFGKVYEDLRILQLTRNLVAVAPVIEIPRDNRRLVETATHPDQLTLLQGEAWTRHALHIEGSGGAQQSAAHAAAMPNAHFGEFMFPNAVEEHLATRLGLNDRTLSLGASYSTPFGQTIDEINIPGHLAPTQELEQAHLVSLEGDNLFIQADPAGQFIYRYSRFGLEKTTP